MTGVWKTAVSWSGPSLSLGVLRELLDQNLVKAAPDGTRIDVQVSPSDPRDPAEIRLTIRLSG